MSKTHLPPTWRSLWKSSAATQADSVHITRRPDVCEEKGECRKTRCSGERPEYSTCTENGHSCGGYGDSVQVRKTLPDNTTNDEKVVGEDTVNLKPSSGNGDRNVTALQISSAGGNSSPGDASHRGDRGSPSSSYATNSVVSTRNRVPYFRYLGPTAIVPGFKQMVVQHLA